MPVRIYGDGEIDGLTTFEADTFEVTNLKNTANAGDPNIVLSANGDTQVQSLNSGPLAGFRNVLLNPYHEVHQRGTGVITFGGAGGAANPTGSDGWRCYPRTSGYTVETRVYNDSIPISFNTPSRNALYMNDTGANDSYNIWQLIELPESGLGPFQPGTKWTLRLVLRTSQSFNLGATLILGTDGSGNTAAVSGVSTDPATSVGNYKEFVFTFDIPDDGSWVRAPGDYTVALRINIGANGVEREVWLGATQLELGPVATPFEHRPIQTEMALCQRYYQKVAHVVMSYTNASSTGSTAMNGAWHYSTTMRAAPSITVGDTVNVAGVISSPASTSARFGATGVGAGNADIRDVTADAEL
jgi:hypothetical protein